MEDESKGLHILRGATVPLRGWHIGVSSDGSQAWAYVAPGKSNRLLHLNSLRSVFTFPPTRQHLALPATSSPVRRFSSVDSGDIWAEVELNGRAEKISFAQKQPQLDTEINFFPPLSYTAGRPEYGSFEANGIRYFFDMHEFSASSGALITDFRYINQRCMKVKVEGSWHLADFKEKTVLSFSTLEFEDVLYAFGIPYPWIKVKMNGAWHLFNLETKKSLLIPKGGFHTLQCSSDRSWWWAKVKCGDIHRLVNLVDQSFVGPASLEGASWGSVLMFGQQAVAPIALPSGKTALYDLAGNFARWRLGELKDT